MKRLAYFLILCSLVVSCKKSGDVPAYVYVPEVQVQTNYPEEGSSSSNISDVWVYVNGDIQGVYELPAWFPVLEEGPQTFQFIGGVKINGIATTRTAYPSYDDTLLTLNLVPGETDTIVPIIKYFTSTEFLLKEDFENGNEFSNVERELNTANVFEGNAVGKVVVDTTRRAIIQSSSFFTIPSYTRTVFVELDYKNSHLLGAGVNLKTAIGNVNVFKLTITEQSDWNKIYINFTPEIARTQATEMQLYFEIDARGDSEPVDVFLDNVKIVYF